MNLLKNKKGNTLLIVLVTIFVLLFIGLYLNKFVVNQIKISNDYAKLKISHYASESGIERSLYLVRKNNISINNVVSNGNYNTENLNNGSSYKIFSDVAYVPDVQTPLIQQGDGYSFDITNYVNSIGSFKMSWDSDGFDIVFVDIARYNRNNHYTTDEFYGIYNHYLNPSVVENIDINSNGNGNETYKFEIYPYLADINNVTITFYSGPNATGNIISVTTGQGQNQRIKSVGNMSNNNNSSVSDFLIDSQY